MTAQGGASHAHPRDGAYGRPSGMSWSGSCWDELVSESREIFHSGAALLCSLFNQTRKEQLCSWTKHYLRCRVVRTTQLLRLSRLDYYSVLISEAKQKKKKKEMPVFRLKTSLITVDALVLLDRISSDHPRGLHVVEWAITQSDMLRPRRCWSGVV